LVEQRYGISFDYGLAGGRGRCQREQGGEEENQVSHCLKKLMKFDETKFRVFKVVRQSVVLSQLAYPLPCICRNWSMVFTGFEHAGGSNKRDRSHPTDGNTRQ
jgi:hypothetical protein